MTDEQAANGEETPVLYERVGAVGVLTLNRPHALNSMRSEEHTSELQSH